MNILHPQSIESLMGVQLSDDIGEWVMDGVLVCQLVNHLHPESSPPFTALWRDRYRFRG